MSGQITCMVALHEVNVKEMHCPAPLTCFQISRLILHSGPQGMTLVVSKPLGLSHSDKAKQAKLDKAFTLGCPLSPCNNNQNHSSVRTEHKSDNYSESTVIKM